MAKYNIIPNASYASNCSFQNVGIHKIEKIIWCKNVGDYLNPGDILCIIHFNDYIFEMECAGGDYLLYKNTDTEISFNNILSIFGQKNECTNLVFEKHQEDLDNYDYSNDPLFRKTFYIENFFSDCAKNLID